MATERQVAYYRLLGASEDEIAALEQLSAKEASPLVDAKVRKRTSEIVAGVRIVLNERCGVITSQYPLRGMKHARVRWDDGKVDSHPVSYFFTSVLNGFDPEIAAQDAFEKRVFAVVREIASKHDEELLPSFNVSATQKTFLTFVQKTCGHESTDEQISFAVEEYIQAWRSRIAKRFRNR